MRILNGKLINEDLKETETIKNIVLKNGQEITNLHKDHLKENEKITYLVQTLNNLEIRVNKLESLKNTLIKLEVKIAQKFFLIILINVIGFISLGGSLIIYEQHNRLENKNNVTKMGK